jgi:hypothetical protein
MAEKHKNSRGLHEKKRGLSMKTLFWRMSKIREFDFWAQ